MSDNKYKLPKDFITTTKAIKPKLKSMKIAAYIINKEMKNVNIMVTVKKHLRDLIYMEFSYCNMFNENKFWIPWFEGMNHQEILDYLIKKEDFIIKNMEKAGCLKHLIKEAISNSKSYIKEVYANETI